MSNRLPAMRPLPLTIVALFSLLVCKSAGIVYAATAALAQPTAAAPVAGAEHTDGRRASDTQTGLPVQLTPSPAAPPTKPDKATAGGAGPVQPAAPDDHELADELARQRKELALRSPAADARGDVLNTAQDRLQQKLDDLAQKQKTAEDARTSRASVDAETWANLAKLYEAMAPRNAAGIFDVTEPRVLVNILDRMNVRKAAAILASMQPERARIATQMLALRQAPPSPDASSVGTSPTHADATAAVAAAQPPAAR